jgi:hypothetical protein
MTASTVRHAHRNGTALTCLLRDLSRAAELQPGVPQWTPRLGGGLTIGLLLDGGNLTLQLVRAYQHPSPVEWATVVRALPYSLTPTAFKPRAATGANGRHVLWATTKVDVQATLVGIGP